MSSYILLINPTWLSFWTTHCLSCFIRSLRKIDERLLVWLGLIKATRRITLLEHVCWLIIENLTYFVLWKLFKHLSLLFNILPVFIQCSSSSTIICSYTLWSIRKACSTFATSIISSFVKILCWRIPTSEHLMILPWITWHSIAWRQFCLLYLDSLNFFPQLLPCWGSSGRSYPVD